MAGANLERKRTAAARRVPAGRAVLLAWLGNVQILAAVVIGVALVLGYIGLWQYLSAKGPATQWGSTWDDILFYDLQLPVLSGAPLQAAGDFPVALSVARFLAPVGTFVVALAALELVLGDQWRGFLAARARGHVVVAGDGAVALALARRLSEGTAAPGAPAGQAEPAGPGQDPARKVVLVSAREDTLAQARQHGILAVQGSPADQATLRAAGIARAAAIYACTAVGAVNTAIALRARDEVPDDAAQPLAAFALVRDAELAVALRARRVGAAGDRRLRLDFFDIEEIAARKLLDRHPLVARDGHPARVVIVGFGQLGQAVLREIARRYRPADGGPPVAVVLKGAVPGQVAAVEAAFPAISAHCSISYDLAPAPGPGGECTVVVCVDGDDDALREGLAMTHALASSPGKVVVCLPQSSPFDQVLAAKSGLVDDFMGRLTVFGVIEEACVPATIRDDFTEQIARSIHRAYVTAQTAKGQTPQVNPSMVPWERLPENLRRSNIAQAADIGAKLEQIHAVVIPDTAAAPAFEFTAEEVERLAQLEHQRWMAEKAADGWKYGQPRNDAAKIHPDLQEWSYLSEDSKDKDRGAIRALPATLADAGFLILRLPSS
jgi:voltage-gated potassium channel Kch